MRNLLALMVVVVCVSTGCGSLKIKSAAKEGTALAIRNNGYSLLHQLLDEEKDVSMLSLIKREDSDVKRLVKKIAATSKTDCDLLEGLAKRDPSVALDDIELPPGEVAARKSIAANKKDALLGRTGDAFELTLLLSQAEALNYAWHLAKVTAENETQPQRIHALTGISNEMEDLYGEVFVLLRSKTMLAVPK
jgi:hypothetical protein